MAKLRLRSAATTWFPVIRDGSDLGSNFDHSDGFLYFLFGDTPSWPGNPDPIGRTNAPPPERTRDRLPVDLMLISGSFPVFLRIDGIRQEEFEVPTGGFSTGDKLHVFFTTDHFNDANTGLDKMGRCVLASAQHPTDIFRVDVDVDRIPGRGQGGVGKFINVCPRIINAADHRELPNFLTDGVMMWGSGDYRASDVYLAFAPLDKVASPSKEGWIYYAGNPFDWPSAPEAAKPLLGERVVGELSVAFIPGLRQWIMLYGGGLHPISAGCRMAPNPWGPWKKITASGNLILSDDRPDGGFEQKNSGPYGFYVIDRFTRWDPATQATLWFPVSENGSGIYRTHLVKTVLQFGWLGRGNRNFIQSDWGGVGNFELLVPQGNVIREYFRNNDDPKVKWHFLREFGYPPASKGRIWRIGRTGQPWPNKPRSVTFFQSTYRGDGVHGNFEAIVRVKPPFGPDHLDFWFFDSGTGQWNGPFPLHADGQPISGVTGDPVLIQSDWGGVGNFELLVPQGNVIREYFRNNDDPKVKWHFLREFGYPPASKGRIWRIGRTGQPWPNKPRSVTFFQSTYRGDGVHGNFEAIVRVKPPFGPDHLDFWFFDSGTGQWNGPFPLHADGQPISGVTGDPVLIQSDWGGVGNFELLVPQGNVIREYFRNNDDPKVKWHFLREFGYPPASKGRIWRIGRTGQPWPNKPRSVTFFQSTYRGDGVHGNFEAIVRVKPPFGPDHLDFWFFDSGTGQWNGPFPLHADGQPISGVTGN